MIENQIKIFGKDIRVTTRNDGDWAIAHELFLDHQYQKCDPIIKLTQNPIIDIGGHLGFFSIYASILNPKVPIYVFEPHEGNYQLLKTNLKNNRIKNVTPKMVAVSNETTQKELQVSQEDLNHSLTGALEPTGHTQTVQTTTLQRIFEKNRIETCDLIKIDCEGSEFDILYATPPELFSKIKTMFIEYHNWTPGEKSQKLKHFLEKQGYKVTDYPNSKIDTLGFFWCQR